MRHLLLARPHGEPHELAHKVPDLQHRQVARVYKVQLEALVEAPLLHHKVREELPYVLELSRKRVGGVPQVTPERDKVVEQYFADARF